MRLGFEDQAGLAGRETLLNPLTDSSIDVSAAMSRHSTVAEQPNLLTVEKSISCRSNGILPRFENDRLLPHCERNSFWNSSYLTSAEIGRDGSGESTKLESHRR